MHMSQKKFLVLQMNDSLFPIGAYSHSYGLETYIQKGIVKDAETAEKYLKMRLQYNFFYTDFLAVKLSYEAALRKNIQKVEELEDILGASRIPEEIRNASRKLGNRFVKTLLAMEPSWKNGVFGNYLEVREGKYISQPCAYGTFCAEQGIPKEEMLEAFLYAQASAIVTNCVKTIPLSQSSGQKLLFSLIPFFEKMMEKIEETGEEMLCLSTPGFDLRSMEHEQLYSRLYMS